jgi:hypothetical protein
MDDPFLDTPKDLARQSLDPCTTVVSYPTETHGLEIPILSEDTVASAEVDDGGAKSLMAGHHSLREKSQPFCAGTA